MWKNLHCLSLLLTCIFLYFFSPLDLQAQDEMPAEDSYTLESPYHTVYTFLDNLQSDNFNPAIAARTLNAEGYSAKEKEDLAVKLQQILDGKGLLVDLDELPRNPDYKDTTANNQERYTLFASMPKIYLEKEGNVWLFSSKTVSSIAQIHREVYPFGLDMLLEMIPKGANQKFLGLSLWQYIGILILAVLAFVLHRLLTYFFGVVLLRFTSRIGRKDIGQKLVQPVARPASLLVLFATLTAIVPVLGLPVGFNRFILLVFNISIPVFVIVIAMNLVDFVSNYLIRAAERTESTLDDQLIPLAKKSLKIIIVILGIIYILQSLEFNITALLTGLSIGTLAFALAAQDTIKNLFGSVTIFLDRPFQVGDWITASGIDGTVEEVGFRSTRVRTFYNSLIYVPNGKLADMVIDNMGLRQYRRFRTTLAITYDTPPELINAFVDGIRQIIQEHPDTRKDYYHVYLNSFGAASLDVLFYAFFSVPDWAAELKARHEVMMAIIRLAKQLGVRFAFPTQTIHIEDLPGQQSLTPQYPQEELKPKHLNEKVDMFISDYYSRPRKVSPYLGKDSGINEDDS